MQQVRSSLETEHRPAGGERWPSGDLGSLARNGVVGCCTYGTVLPNNLLGDHPGIGIIISRFVSPKKRVYLFLFFHLPAADG